MAQFNALDMIAKHESAWRNVKTGAQSADGFNLSTGTYTAPSTASGYWQITNSTWKSYAPNVGVDLGQYPTAMSAPYDVQRSVAGNIYDKRGFADWAPYNSNIRADLGKYGQGAYGSDSEVSPSPPNGLGYSPSPGSDPNNFGDRTISGYSPKDDTAPGSFSNGQDPNNYGDPNDLPQEYKDGQSPNDFGDPGGNTDTYQDGEKVAQQQQSDYLTGENVSAPKAGNVGNPKNVPIAIVTGANQEATATANAAKTQSEAALKAAKTTDETNTKLQAEQQSWGSNWATRIFLFLVGLIFIGGALFLFGGQAIFQAKSPAR